MGEVVGCKMDLITVFGNSGRNIHDTGIAYEDVQAVSLGDDQFRRLLDGRQRREVTFDEYNVNGGGRRLDLGDDLSGLRSVAATEIKAFRVVFRESENRLFSNSRRSSGNENYFAGKVRNMSSSAIYLTGYLLKEYTYAMPVS